MNKVTGDSIRYEPATADHVPGIVSIYNHAIVNTISTFDIEEQSVGDKERWLESLGESHPVIVARRGDEVLGFAALAPWSPKGAYDRTAELSIYVRHDTQGAGIGTELLRRILGAGKECGLHTVIARIADHGEVSYRLHVRAGFEVVGTMKDAGFKFGRAIDVVIMQVML